MITKYLGLHLLRAITSLFLCHHYELGALIPAKNNFIIHCANEQRGCLSCDPQFYHHVNLNAKRTRSGLILIKGDLRKSSGMKNK